MKLDYIHVDNTYRYYSNVKYLFEHAFPEEERPPFKFLIKLDKNQFFGIEDNGEFIGLISYVEYQNLLYIFFLAIKKKYRHKGYGSQVLQDMLNKYSGKRVFLLAEDPHVPNDNQEERDSRIRFYNHNGLKVTGVKIVEYEIPYIILSSGGEVNKQAFLNCMQYLIGDYFSIYRHNVRQCNIMRAYLCYFITRFCQNRCAKNNAQVHI